MIEFNTLNLPKICWGSHQKREEILETSQCWIATKTVDLALIRIELRFLVRLVGYQNGKEFGADLSGSKQSDPKSKGSSQWDKALGSMCWC
jgi:hypothetical protein